MNGYRFTIDGTTYHAHKDGRPLSVVDCWEAVNGCGSIFRGGAPVIHAPDGRVVLINAGSQNARRAHIAACRRRNRHAARLMRLAILLEVDRRWDTPSDTPEWADYWTELDTVRAEIGAP